MSAKAASETPTAGLLRRLPAIVIDSLPAVLITAAGYALGVFDASVFQPKQGWFWTEWLLRFWLDSPWVLLSPALTIVLLAMITSAGFEALWSTSLGGRLLGLRVVDDRDFDITPARAGLRLLAALVNVATLGLGYLWMFVSRYRRGWHDLLTGSYVVVDRE
mgnify:CR=1 FL=1